MISKTEQNEKITQKYVYKVLFIHVHAPIEACILHINSTYRNVFQ